MSDFSSALDSAVAAGEAVADNTTVTESPDPVESTSDAPEELDAPEQTPEPAEPEATDAGENAPVEAAPAAPEVDDEYDETPPTVSKDGRTMFFRRSKGERMLASDHLRKQIEQEIPGATLDSLKEHYQNSTVMQQMLNDWDSGTTDGFQRWASFHLDPKNNPNPQTISMLADTLVEKLPTAFPQVYEQMRGSVMQREVEGLYQKAMQTGDQAVLKLAQNLDFTLTGRFKETEQLNRPDTFETERRKLDAEKKQFRDEQASLQSQRVSQLMQEMDNQTDTAVDDEIAVALKPVEAQFKDTPQWRHMQRDLREAVESARKANTTWARQFQVLKDQAKANPTRESRQRVVDMMRTFAKLQIAPRRKAVIDSVTQGVLKTSQAVNKKLETAAARREPAGGGAPSNRTSTMTQQVREMAAKGASGDDVMKALLARL